VGAERSVEAVVDEIVQRLRAGAQAERAAAERTYLKSSLEHWGVGVPGTRAVVRDALPPRSAPGHDLVASVADALWAEPVHERRLAAAMVLALHVRELGPADLAMVERMLREAKTWALVDVLAPDVAGPVYQASPVEAGPVLDRWSVDGDVWLRRSAVLALLKLLRKSPAEWDRFCGYAEAMWTEREFFVRKALGWVLRDMGRRHPDLVVAFVLPRAAAASGVTIREAVKYLPPADRAAIEAARR
jgi:3-methyladenine DNA glycosylase AlkD